MTALLTEKIPVRFAITVCTFGKAHHLERVSGKILRILVTSYVPGLGAGQLVPLLAGYLAATASRTLGGVYNY
jgi:hypothetical protein